MPLVASHTLAVERSGIRTVADLVWQHTRPVIGLHLGEPDSPTPAHIVRAMSDALAAGRTGYAPNRGLPELVEAIAAKVLCSNGLTASTQQIIVTAGGMQAIQLALTATLQAGDEVFVPDPGWPNYAMAVRALQARVVPYALHGAAMLPDIGHLEGLLTARTRVLVVNSPANPQGTVLPRAVAEALVGFAQRHGLWLLSDECYEAFVFDGEHVSLGSLDDSCVLTCFSFSKTYAMTGLRVGYLVGPCSAIDVCAQIQESTVACVNTPAQLAAVAALTGPQDATSRMKQALRQRRAAAAALLRAGSLHSVLPGGAFYTWIRLDGVDDPNSDPCDDVAFAVRLLNELAVGVAPGSAFGRRGRGWLRVSLTVEEKLLLTGLQRLIELAAAEPKES